MGADCHAFNHSGAVLHFNSSTVYGNSGICPVRVGDTGDRHRLAVFADGSGHISRICGKCLDHNGNIFVTSGHDADLPVAVLFFTAVTVGGVDAEMEGLAVGLPPGIRAVLGTVSGNGRCTFGGRIGFTIVFIGRAEEVHAPFGVGDAAQFHENVVAVRVVVGKVDLAVECVGFALCLCGFADGNFTVRYGNSLEPGGFCGHGRIQNKIHGFRERFCIGCQHLYRPCLVADHFKIGDGVGCVCAGFGLRDLISTVHAVEILAGAVHIFHRSGVGHVFQIYISSIAVFIGTVENVAVMSRTAVDTMLGGRTGNRIKAAEVRHAFAVRGFVDCIKGDGIVVGDAFVCPELVPGQTCGAVNIAFFICGEGILNSAVQSGEIRKGKRIVRSQSTVTVAAHIACCHHSRNSCFCRSGNGSVVTEYAENGGIGCGKIKRVRQQTECLCTGDYRIRCLDAELFAGHSGEDFTEFLYGKYSIRIRCADCVPCICQNRNLVVRPVRDSRFVCRTDRRGGGQHRRHQKGANQSFGKFG